MGRRGGWAGATRGCIPLRGTCPSNGLGGGVGPVGWTHNSSNHNSWRGIVHARSWRLRGMPFAHSIELISHSSSQLACINDAITRRGIEYVYIVYWVYTELPPRFKLVYDSTTHSIPKAQNAAPVPPVERRRRRGRLGVGHCHHSGWLFILSQKHRMLCKFLRRTPPEAVKWVAEICEI